MQYTVSLLPVGPSTHVCGSLGNWISLFWPITSFPCVAFVNGYRATVDAPPGSHHEPLSDICITFGTKSGAMWSPLGVCLVGCLLAGLLTLKGGFWSYFVDWEIMFYHYGTLSHTADQWKCSLSYRDNTLIWLAKIKYNQLFTTRNAFLTLAIFYYRSRICRIWLACSPGARI